MSKNRKRNSETNRGRLARLKIYMQFTPLGQKIWDWLEQENIQISFDKTLPRYVGAATMAPFDSIRLNPSEGDFELITAIAHESRHLWQARAFAKEVGVDAPVLDGYFEFNPWALTIFNRFLEADAFAFEHIFLMDYLANFSSRDDTPFQELNIQPNEASVMALDQTGFDVDGMPDVMPDLLEHRKVAFESFFKTQTVHYYDAQSVGHNTEDHDHMENALSFIFNKEATKSDEDLEVINERMNNLHENHLAVLGKSAWGELEGRNYLTGKRGSLPFKGLYRKNIGSFSATALKKFEKLEAHAALNTYQRANGKKQKLISV